MKTLAIRLDDNVHAQLSAIAALEGVTITDEIRQALDAHLDAKRRDPKLTARASSVLDDIERDSRERQAAISALFASDPPSEPSAPTKAPAKKTGPQA